MNETWRICLTAVAATAALGFLMWLALPHSAGAL